MICESGTWNSLMAITLPPAIPPENVPLADFSGRAEAHPVIPLGQRRVHVFGADAVERSQLEEVVSKAASPSAAVYAIQAAVYRAGYPAARVRYALAEPNLYVMVVQPSLTGIDMPAPYARYFERAQDPAALDAEALEPSRLLASIHADRAGQQGALSLRPQGEGVQLGFNPQDAQGSRLKLRAGVGNPGTRFLGRYFGDYAAQASSRQGDELAFTGRHALSGFNDSEGDYTEHSLAYSKVTSLGIAGLSLRNLDYRSDQDFAGFPEPISLDGELQQVEASWVIIPAAGFLHRWGLGAKLDYNHKRVRADDFEALLQKQEYASAEVALDYTVALGSIGQPIQLGSALSVRHGLGGDREDEQPALANLGYWLVRPALSVGTTFDTRFNVSLALLAQFSDDRVPEQQQWVSGGAGHLEAFLPGVIVGDSGGLARLQVGFPGWERGEWKLVPSVFTEYVRANLDVPDPDRQSATTSAADIGAALAMSWRRRIDATLAYSEPLTDTGLRAAALDDVDAGLLFRVSLMY